MSFSNHKASRYKIFLSCSFPPSPLANQLLRLGGALGLEIFTAEQSRVAAVLDKVRDMMFAADGALFLLEDESPDSSSLSHWILAEYGIARSMRKTVGFVVAHGAPQPPPTLQSDAEYLQMPAHDAQCAESIVRYLRSFGEALDAAHAPPDHFKPTFIRRILRHRIRLGRTGGLLYETEVTAECRKNGLSDFRHSIHMNYSLCWPDLCGRPEVELINKLTSGHELSMELVSVERNKFTWKIGIEPPLREGEVISYGYRTRFDRYLPYTRAELAPLEKAYPFGEGGVGHHYYINNPTDRLDIIVCFEDGSIATEFTAMACVGRTISERTRDLSETRRLASALVEKAFLGEKEVTLTVEKPQMGYTYAVVWALQR